MDCCATEFSLKAYSLISWDVVWNSGEEVSAQVSSSSLDCGSKFRAFCLHIGIDDPESDVPHSSGSILKMQGLESGESKEDVVKQCFHFNPVVV
ncbi:hypothetical protein TNCV_1759761 [Trichonephila clavipes]|nr:hypothetical protein TNCV_1759761 [Trichonephila clavipes]